MPSLAPPPSPTLSWLLQLRVPAPDQPMTLVDPLLSIPSRENLIFRQRGPSGLEYFALEGGERLPLEPGLARAWLSANPTLQLADI